MTQLSPTPTRPALSTDDLAALVTDLAAQPARWRALVQLGDGERWWTRLHSDDLVDVWLITWSTGTGTELHDHGGSAAAFTVVGGELQEVRPSTSATGLAVAAITSGRVRTVAPGVVHDVQNTAATPAVSIHAYSPPLASMTFYDRTPGGLVPARTVSTTGPEA